MILKSLKVNAFLCVLLLLVSGCVSKHFSHRILSCNQCEPLFIEVPQNNLAFENLAPAIYEVLSDHFQRVGFTLHQNNKNCYTLRVRILNVDSSHKFLSPDLLTYSVTMKMEFDCQLLDTTQKICAQKKFSFTALISEPKDYIMNSEFFDYGYRQTLIRNVHKIDQYFRKYLLKTA